VARATLDFVQSEMLSPEGAFLSAIDAETDGHEGAYYTWTREELRTHLAGDHDLFGGIRVLATPGHTPGHQSLVVDVVDGRTIIAGQAVYTAGEWAGDPDAREGRSRAPDKAAYDRSIERLRRLDPARVYFGHDRRSWTASAAA